LSFSVKSPQAKSHLKNFTRTIDFYAFFDIAPQAPVHFLIIPKKHIENVMVNDPGDAALMGNMLYRAQILAKAQGLEESGARFIFNCKADADKLSGTFTSMFWGVAVSGGLRLIIAEQTTSVLSLYCTGTLIAILPGSSGF
jgi:hypothetical protein